MKLLHFEYKMQLDFDEPVRKHQFTVKCTPRSNQRQEIRELYMEIEPRQSLSEGTDAFGNTCIFGYADIPHSRFSVLAKGEAVTGLSAYEQALPYHRLGMYRYQSSMTRPGKYLTDYAKGINFDLQSSHFTKALTIMERLYKDFTYESGATTIMTTAEEAMRQRRGVCQDYSHIMISLCRIFGIPARYVVGMLMGEGLSHAWIEIYDGGMWIGLDPTNNLIVDDQHIKISSGRDYNDCLINQGLFVGGAGQTQTISVQVYEIERETNG